MSPPDWGSNDELINYVHTFSVISLFWDVTLCSNKEILFIMADIKSWSFGAKIKDIYILVCKVTCVIFSIPQLVQYNSIIILTKYWEPSSNWRLYKSFSDRLKEPCYKISGKLGKRVPVNTWQLFGRDCWN